MIRVALTRVHQGCDLKTCSLPGDYFKKINCHECSQQLEDITAAWRKTQKENGEVGENTTSDSHLSED